MRRLALARRGVDVGGEAPRRRRPAQQAAVLGAADGDRAAGEVGQHGRPGERGLGARRHRHPHVLADLDVQHEARHVLGGEQQVGPERHLRRPAEADRAAQVVAGRDLAALVELAVGRQVRLGRHAEHPAAVHDDGAVVDPVAVAERQRRRPAPAAGPPSRRRSRQRRLDRVEQRVLQQDVLDRVAGERQLREDDEPDALVGALPGRGEHGRGVRGGVADRRCAGCRGDAQEAVPVGGAEVRAVGHGRAAVPSGRCAQRTAVCPRAAARSCGSGDRGNHTGQAEVTSATSCRLPRSTAARGVAARGGASGALACWPVRRSRPTALASRSPRC